MVPAHGLALCSFGNKSYGPRFGLPARPVDVRSVGRTAGVCVPRSSLDGKQPSLISGTEWYYERKNTAGITYGKGANWGYK